MIFCSCLTMFIVECHNFIKHLLQPDPRARPSVRDVMSHSWLAESRLSSSSPTITIPLSNGHMSEKMDVDNEIVNYIWNTYGIQSSHVSNSVICKRADEYSAIYYLLIRRREREGVHIMKSALGHKVEREDQPKITELRKSDGKDLDTEKEIETEKEVLAEMVSFE